MGAETAARAPAGRIAAEIAEQAQRAVTRHLPVFLLVFYRQEAEKLDFLAALRKELREHGLHSRTFDPHHRPEHGAGRLYAELAGAGERTLSLVAEVPREPEGIRIEADFLRYLNLHRDRIGRERLRWVLLLHDADAEQFIHAAGDLWDVRQHTYWLEREEGRRGQGLWLELEERTPALTLPEPDREAIAEHVKRVRKLVEETPKPEDRATLLADLSTWLARRDAMEAAAQVALEGLAEAPEEVLEVRADLELAAGFALMHDSHLVEALNHYEASLALQREMGDRRGEAVALNSISQIYRIWGRQQEALGLLEASLALRREVGDRGGEGVVLNNIAQIYRSLGHQHEALEALETSLTLSREVGDRRGEAVTLNNIAQIYRGWGRQEEALKTLESSLTLKREDGDRRGEATALNSIGRLYLDMGRQQEALEMLGSSLALSRDVGDRRGEAVALNNIAQLYKDMGRRQEALEMLESSLAVCREAGDVGGEARASWNLAQLFEELDDLEKAVALARRTVEIEEQMQHPDLEEHRAHLAELERLVEHQRIARAGMVAEDTPDYGC